MLSSEVTSAISFERRNLGTKLEEPISNLINMHLIQSLKNKFCFDLAMFSKYPATSINIGVVEAFSREGTFSRSWFLLEMFQVQY